VVPDCIRAVEIVFTEVFHGLPQSVCAKALTVLSNIPNVHFTVDDTIAPHMLLYVLGGDELRVLIADDRL
jgi:hypothetical protein